MKIEEIRSELKELSPQLKYLKLLEKKGSKVAPSASKTKGYKVTLANLPETERQRLIEEYTQKIKILQSDEKYLSKLIKKSKEPKQPSKAERIQLLKIEIAKLNAEEIKYSNGFYDTQICTGMFSSACSQIRKQRISEIQIKRAELVVELTQLGG